MACHWKTWSIRSIGDYLGMLDSQRAWTPDQTNKQTAATSKRFWSHCEEETYDAIPWLMACHRKTESQKLSTKWKCNDPKEPEPQIKQLTNKQTGATSKMFWSHCEEQKYDAIPWLMACHWKMESRKLSTKWKCNDPKEPKPQIK